ncbi:MAG: sigma-70 family RNA polymerase sigma factor [Alphaproteobacteria bacterium]
MAAADDSPPLELREARERFLALVENVRPELHRYCARMTGSIIDGEDVVQETLAKAYYALSMMETVPRLKPWLFRIAHNKALDWLRRYERRHVISVEDVELDEAMAVEPEDPVERRETASLALSFFVSLPPRPRSAVILKDVLDHSIREVAEILDMTEAAVKAALHRGRRALDGMAVAEDNVVPPAVEAPADVARYVELFNARDWNALRSMLAEDVRLDLVGKAGLRGKEEVGGYFDRYSRQDVTLRLGTFEDGIAILATQDGWPPYVIRLTCRDGRVTHIRDFRYVPYILNGV